MRVRDIRRALGATPIQAVFRKLGRRGVDTSRLSVLEVFGASGDFHTKDYAYKVGRLEVWEINDKLESALRRNLPDAAIKITDSYQEIARTNSRYDMIVIDNPLSFFGPDEKYCEHFEMFPAVFRLIDRSCILIVNVIPRLNRYARKKWPYMFNPKQLAKRAEFYRTDRPEDVPYEKMTRTYSALAESSGLEMEWIFYERRRIWLPLELIGRQGVMHYAVMRLSRRSHC